MRPTTPPRLATALLNRFAANDPLAGDIQEEYRAGRSVVWYWRQTLMAVVIALLRRGDWHDVFAAQGMLMQCVMLGLVSVCAVFTVKVTAWIVLRDGMAGLLEPSALRELIRVGLAFTIAIVIGMMIARLHERSRSAAIVAFSTAVTVWASGNLYLLDGHGSLDSVLPQVMAALVFICGLLTGGLHADLAIYSRRVRRRS
jgi:hypothetical protein